LIRHAVDEKYSTLYHKKHTTSFTICRFGTLLLVCHLLEGDNLQSTIAEITF